MPIEEQNAIREFNRQQNEIAKAKWLKDTQDMVDYFTKYGYEETCKKFNVNITREALIMRFTRARKKCGIVFKS